MAIKNYKNLLLNILIWPLKIIKSISIFIYLFITTALCSYNPNISCAPL